jgi:hypothetical protein
VKSDLRNIKERSEEDREKMDKIYDVTLKTAAGVENIVQRLEGGDERFKGQDEEIKKLNARVGALETWKSNHGVVGRILGGFWIFVSTLAGAAIGAMFGSVHFGK